MSEILDRTAYQRPGSFSEATGRMSKNMNYFKINYVLFTAAVLAAFILYNPTSLIILSLIGAAWTYVYLVRTEPLKIGDRPISEREKLLGMSGASLLVVFFMSSAGSIIFQAFGVALLCIGAHPPRGCRRPVHRRCEQRGRVLLLPAAPAAGHHRLGRVENWIRLIDDVDEDSRRRRGEGRRWSNTRGAPDGRTEGGGIEGGGSLQR